MSANSYIFVQPARNSCVPSLISAKVLMGPPFMEPVERVYSFFCGSKLCTAYIPSSRETLDQAYWVNWHRLWLFVESVVSRCKCVPSVFMRHSPFMLVSPFICACKFAGKPVLSVFSIINNSVVGEIARTVVTARMGLL